MPGSPGVARRDIVVRRFESAADADRHDLEYWQQMPEAERVLQVWRLSEQQWMLHGYQRYEPGLHRSVASIRRR